MNLFPGKAYDVYSAVVSNFCRCRNLAEMQSALLEGVRQLIPADSAVLLLFQADGMTATSSMAWNLDPSRFNHYRDYYQQFDHYKEAVHTLASPPGVDRSSDFMDYSAWSRNEHRADFLLPQGIYHISCLNILRHGHVAASLSLHREQRHDNFSDQDVEILNVLSPVINGVYHTLVRPPFRWGEAAFLENLTVREREILPLLVLNLSNEEIAFQLNISLNTVKTHIRHILGKADCSSRFELVVKYSRPTVPATGG